LSAQIRTYSREVRKQKKPLDILWNKCLFASKKIEVDAYLRGLIEKEMLQLEYSLHVIGPSLHLLFDMQPPLTLISIFWEHDGHQTSPASEIG